MGEDRRPAGTGPAGRTWTTYYVEGNIITFERTVGLPRELPAPPLYAVAEGTPREYRLPRDGRWEPATWEEVEAARNLLIRRT